MTDFRELCAELVRIADALDGQALLVSNQGQALDGYSALAAFRDVATRARTALAEPEPEGPTDEEIMELMPQQMRDDLAAAARALSGFDADNIKAASAFRIILNRHCVDHARAVLARWGRSDGPAVPDGREPASVASEASGAVPAACEVAKLVAWLNKEAERVAGRGWTSDFRKLTSAADLLERLSPSQPIAVSERLPKEPLAWWFTPESDEEYGWWVLEPNGMEREPQPTHWLPVNALPFP